MRVIGVLTLGAVILAIGANGVVLADPNRGMRDLVVADQPQPVAGRGVAGGQAQMGPASRKDSTAMGGAAPTTPEELQRREQQLDRVNRSPGRPPHPPDAPAMPPASGSYSPSPQQPARVADCQVFPTFAPLLAVVPAVGDCLQDAYTDWFSGDLVQVTTGGVLVQRAANATAAFTDGQQTWVLAPNGLEAILGGDV
jgi:hypothetical protein